MSPTLAIAAVLVAAGLALVLAAVRIRRADPVAQLVAEFEGDVTAVGAGADQRLGEPLPVRLLGPLAERARTAVTDLAPSSMLASLRTELARAGLSSRVTAEEFLVMRVLAAGVGAAVFLAAVVGVGGFRGVALGGLGLVVGLLLPPAMLARARRERVEAIELDLPDSLDLLAISVEAGLGFEQALAGVVESRATPLSDELGHTLREIQLGRSRAEALHELDRRVDVGDLSSLVLSLVQADALGMPLTRVLRSQAAELRRRRRQRVREAAAKLPVKILVPMTLFILPALLAIVLGPAVLSLVSSLAT